MRVNQSGVNSAQGANTEELKSLRDAKNSKNAEKKSSTHHAKEHSGVSTEISGRAKEAAQAKQLAMSAPDTREEKIAELKKRIAEGRYRVDAEKVADKMVKDHLEL